MHTQWNNVQVSGLKRGAYYVLFYEEKEDQCGMKYLHKKKCV